MQNANRLVVYTIVFNGYDAIFPVRNRSRGVDHILISDQDAPRGSGWTMRPPPPELETLSAAEKNRWCKFFPHRLFPDYDTSVYLDGNVQLLNPLNAFVDALQAQEAGIGLFKHPDRISLSEELDACVALGKLLPAVAEKVAVRIAQYEEKMELSEKPLTENGVIFRDHAAPHLDDAMEHWWHEYRLVHRDQIALPWVLGQSPLKAAFWKWSYRNPNPWFLGPVIPHLGNLPPGLSGRFRLFLKHQKLRYRNTRAIGGFDMDAAIADFM